MADVTSSTSSVSLRPSLEFLGDLDEVPVWVRDVILHVVTNCGLNQYTDEAGE